MAAGRVQGIGTSVFSVYSRLARKAGAIDLGQGFPDFDGPAWLLEAAAEAARHGPNQYAMSHGSPRLRAAIAADAEARLDLRYDADTEITVTSGATEGIAAAMLGILDPGDEVIAFEPFYDSYPACAAFAGATLRAVPLRKPDFHFVPGDLAGAFTDRTRLLVLNTPHNPTGRVFTREECETIVSLCRRHGCRILSDEVYEHLVYDDRAHVSPASLDRDRVVRLSSAAKTFSVTGWKVGWACAPPALTDALRRAHQFLVFCSAAPLQDAVALGLEQGARHGYYERLRADYSERRAALIEALRGAGYRVEPPEGSYFAMADVSGVAGPVASAAFVERLITTRKVGAIPPDSFYRHAEHAAGLVRFAFCKRVETLRKAGTRLAADRQD